MPQLCQLSSNTTDMVAYAASCCACRGIIRMQVCCSYAACCSTVAACCSTVAACCPTVAACCPTVAACCSTVAAQCSTVAAHCSTVAAVCLHNASSLQHGCVTLQSRYTIADYLLQACLLHACMCCSITFALQTAFNANQAAQAFRCT